MANRTESNELITVEDVRRRYTGHWILMHVMANDSDGNPGVGRLLAVSKNRKTISNKLKKLPSVSPDPSSPTPYFVFHVGPTPEQTRFFERMGWWYTKDNAR